MSSTASTGKVHETSFAGIVTDHGGLSWPGAELSRNTVNAFVVAVSRVTSAATICPSSTLFVRKATNNLGVSVLTTVNDAVAV